MKTGVFFCQLEDRWPTDIDAKAKYSQNLPEVQTVKNFGIRPNLYIEDLIKLIKTNELERVVIAGDLQATINQFSSKQWPNLAETWMKYAWLRSRNMVFITGIHRIRPKH